MALQRVLENACITLDIKSDTKTGIIEEMVELLVAAGRVTDRDAVVAAVLEREEKMSTGMQFGVAIPHGKTAAVEELVTALAIKREGVDFSSFDGEPSNIFVMTVSPINRTGPHIQYLSDISKLLNRPSIRKRLLEAETVEEVVEILSE